MQKGDTESWNRIIEHSESEGTYKDPNRWS